MRELSRGWNLFVDMACGLWGLFFVYMGIRGTLPAMTIIPACFPIAIIITFALYPADKKRSAKTRPSGLDLLIMVISIPVSLYLVSQADKYMDIQGLFEPATLIDSICGLILTIIFLEAGRRTVGWLLVGLVLCSLLYIVFFCRYLPGRWYHSGWRLDDFFGEMARDNAGGFPSKLPFVILSIVAIYIYMGDTLFATRLGGTFMNVAKWVGSKIPGGAGQVSVISSALFGTMSGSAVANVVVDGVFNIPIMKASGFKAPFAAAIEATASTGGMIMPPVMGAAAFLIPEFIPGITYFDVIKAAIIPGVMYFFLVGVSIYFYAKKHGIGKLSSEMAVDGKTIIRDWPGLIISVAVLGVLMLLLYERWPESVCGTAALLTGAILHLVIGGPPRLGAVKERFLAIVKGFVAGGRVLSWIYLLLAALQILVYVLSVTGLGFTISSTVLRLAGGGKSLVPALIVAAVSCTIMGMGVTSTSAYIIVVAILGNTLTKLVGIPIAAHLFIFYYCMLGCLTPPVCAAVYPAAAIAKTPWLPVAWYACLLGLVAFVAPFMFVYGPQLLMIGSPVAIIQCIVTGAIGIVFLSSGIWGYLTRRTLLFERILMGAGGFLLMIPGYFDLEGGIILAVSLIIYHFVPRLSASRSTV